MIQSSNIVSLNKYCGLLITVSLLLIFNILLLALSFYASSTLDNDAVSINLAGYLCVLLQLTTKIRLNSKLIVNQINILNLLFSHRVVRFMVKAKNTMVSNSTSLIINIRDCNEHESLNCT